MREIDISLSVFHDGQFFVALFERQDETDYSAAKRVFGACPSDEEILQMIAEEYMQLRFSKPSAHSGGIVKPVRSPKRAQRNAAKAMRHVGSSTKSQTALQAQRAQCKTQRKVKSRADKEAMAQRKFELRQEKRRQKRRGH